MTDATTRPRILFVDGDDGDRSALQEALEAQADCWEMEFLASNEAAIARLGEVTAAAIVADISMPLVGDRTLLETAVQLSPGTLRFVLAGECSESDTVRGLAVAHQWMSKPLEAEAVVATLQRSLDLFQRFSMPAVQAAMGETTVLPSAPGLYHKICAAMRDPDTEMEDVAEWVEADPALTAKVLQLTNSSFFGLRREVLRVFEAICTLGLRLLADVVLVTELFENWGESEVTGRRNPATVLRHAKEVANASRVIASDAGFKPEDHVSAALLHEVGVLIMNLRWPAEGDGPEVVPEGQSWMEAERARLGCSHAEMGGALLSSWGLPLALTEAVTWHLEPSAAERSEFDHVGVLHVANALVEGLEPDLEYLEAMGVSGHLEEWTRRFGRRSAA